MSKHDNEYGSALPFSRQVRRPSHQGRSSGPSHVHDLPTRYKVSAGCCSMCARSLSLARGSLVLIYTSLLFRATTMHQTRVTAFSGVPCSAQLCHSGSEQVCRLYIVLYVCWPASVQQQQARLVAASASCLSFCRLTAHLPADTVKRPSSAWHDAARRMQQRHSAVRRVCFLKHLAVLRSC